MQFWKKTNPTFKIWYPFQLHFVLCLTLLYLDTIKKMQPFMFTCSIQGITHFLLKISLDQSFTVLVVKHNIQVSTEWFPESKIWNFIINKYIFTKDTGFNLPLIHFKISFKTHSTCHNIKNNSILNYALSTKISFHLCLTGLDIRFHYHVTTTV